MEKGITAGDNEMIQKAWLDGVSQIVNRNVFQEFYERYCSLTVAAMKDQVPYEGGLRLGWRYRMLSSGPGDG